MALALALALSFAATAAANNKQPATTGNQRMCVTVTLSQQPVSQLVGQLTSQQLDFGFVFDLPVIVLPPWRVLILL